MKNLKFPLFALLVLSIFATSCKKKHKHDEHGTVKMSFSHTWGMNNAPFALNTQLIHPMNGDTMNFSTFKYYVSNIQLKKNDGTWWTMPESYFLVDVSSTASLTLEIPEVPEGTYTAFKYTMGVDSTRNVSGAQAGSLSTTNGMFWSWNTGYIMVKAEGTSPQSSTGNFAFHLGGFSGANNIVTTTEVPLTDNLVVSHETVKTINMRANPARLFHGDESVSNGGTVMMPGTRAKTLATNFYGGVTFLGIE
jgi:hypothetical protein